MRIPSNYRKMCIILCDSKLTRAGIFVPPPFRAADGQKNLNFSLRRGSVVYELNVLGIRPIPQSRKQNSIGY